MSRVTLKEVAARAGVSYQTVSNVLNDSAAVREATRERVLRAVRELDYQPHFGAKSLREARSMTLSCVFFEQEPEAVADPYRNVIQSACTFEANARGYSLFAHFLVRQQPGSFDTLRQQFQQRRFDGAVVVGTNIDPESARSLKAWGLPTVLFDYAGAPLGLPTVAARYDQGMRALVDHHAARGRRRLALVLPPDPDVSTAAARAEGFWQGVRAHGLEGLTEPGDWTFSSGERAFQALWAREDQPDAVLAGNDRMAAGSLLAARRLGLRVPEDVAISGFDDFEFGLYTAPTLTTVHVPYVEMAREATLTLLDLLHTPGLEPVVTWLPTAVVPRESA